ncbi:MAG: SGNH/GDSL hydrolase family protein, partial [Bacteroidales bacterium]
SSSYTYNNTERDPRHSHGFEYRLYLPLYNSVTSLEIGIPEGSELQFIPIAPERPIVIYGTSIVQGACASRPAMAWSTIMQRSLGYPLLNFGFSGNGKLEKEVLQFISEPNARLFILDCLANIANKSESEVTNLVIEAVKQLRKTSSAPILLIESAGYSNSWTDKTKHDELIKVNSGSLKAYNAIQTEGIKEVYYISREDINFPVDGWVDYV